MPVNTHACAFFAARVRGLTILDGPYVTGWVQMPNALVATCRVWLAVRGWLGIRRYYSAVAHIDHWTGYRNKREGETVDGAAVRIGNEDVLPGVIIGLRGKIKYDFTDPFGRWDAANADFANWSEARWRLLDDLNGGPTFACV